MGNPLVALGVRPPEQGDSLLEKYARVMSLKGMIQSQRVNEQQLHIAREERKRQSRKPKVYPPAGLRESTQEPIISPVR